MDRESGTLPKIQHSKRLKYSGCSEDCGALCHLFCPPREGLTLVVQNKKANFTYSTVYPAFCSGILEGEKDTVKLHDVLDR